MVFRSKQNFELKLTGIRLCKTYPNLSSLKKVYSVSANIIQSKFIIAKGL